MASSSVYPQIQPGQTANDKIIILEDTNHDGKADKSTVFADGLLIPTGIEPGNGGAYVANSTELLFFKDIDGDGKADFVNYRNGTWYRLVNGQNIQLNVPFGAAGDKPLLADFDGDGKADPAIFRPSPGIPRRACRSAP